MNKDIKELKRLSSNVSEDIDIKKLDEVYDTILLPLFKREAAIFKTNKVRITSNEHQNTITETMKRLFGGKFNLQSLIETEMKPYLEKRGYFVIIWNPNYSVEVSW